MPSTQLQVLLVEDHHDLALTLCDFLTLQGVIVDHARNLGAARQLLARNYYHVLLLDINLPDGNGYAFCQMLRREQGLSMPVLMLTARDSVEDKLAGFEAGTDDYLVKPFELSELLARIQALDRRARGSVAVSRWVVHDLCLDLNLQSVSRAGQPIELAPVQFRLLSLLMRRAPQVVSRAEMMLELWGEEEPESDALRSHIYLLRKLIDKPFDTPLLHTVPGVGVRLCAPATA